MRIGVNTLFYIPGEVGGSETYLRGILRQFATRLPKLELVLFSNIENDRTLRKIFEGFSQIEFHRLPFRAQNRAIRIIYEQTILAAAVHKTKVDLLWSPGYTMPFYAPCPQVVSILDMQYKEFPDDWTAPARLANRFLIPMAVRRSARVITISMFAKQHILRYVSVPPEHIQVIYLAADESLEQIMPETEKQERLSRLLPSNSPYILCVANTYPHKNVHTLIEAYKRLAQDIPQQLVLVGSSGLGESRVRRSLEDLTNPERVLRLHHLPWRDVIALYQGADLFVFPSLYEGFGLPVLEAMKAGVPVIAAHKASIPEIGGDSICYCDGTRDDLVEKIRRMLVLDAPEKTRLTKKAQQMASAFTWEQTAEETVRCFEAVLHITRN